METQNFRHKNKTQLQKINETDHLYHSKNEEPVIQLSNVWLRYSSTPLLEDITFRVYGQQIVSIVGPNGSGKTTLLKAILGFLKPYQGDIKIFGRSPKEIQNTGWIGYLPQLTNYDNNFPMQAKDVVALARYANETPGKRLSKYDKELIDHSLAQVNMTNFKNHHFGSLSGGQKQRILIARALTLQPKMLILDEPSTGLDSVAQDSFYELLQELREEQNLTILMVSHDIGTVSTIVDTIACINQKLHFHGPPSECKPDDNLARIFGKNIFILQHDEHCDSCGTETSKKNNGRQ